MDRVNKEKKNTECNMDNLNRMQEQLNVRGLICVCLRKREEKLRSEKSAQEACDGTRQLSRIVYWNQKLSPALSLLVF